MEDWALMDEDRPPPRGLYYSLMLAAILAGVSLLLMGGALAVFFLVPSSWLP